VKLSYFSVTMIAAAFASSCTQEPPSSETFASQDGAAQPGETTPAPITTAEPVGDTTGTLSAAGRMITTEGPPDGAATYSDACLITENSIAGVPSPSTLGAFAASFPAGSQLAFEPFYMVDLGSLCLIEDGAEKVCTWFFVYDTETWDPDVEATGLFTSSPACMTADGIGPGTPVADAGKLYGEPDFQFNYDNEGREYLGFSKAPEGMSFRASSATAEGKASAPSDDQDQHIHWPNGLFGGDYSVSRNEEGGAFATNTPLPDAVIATVILP